MIHKFHGASDTYEIVTKYGVHYVHSVLQHLSLEQGVILGDVTVPLTRLRQDAGLILRCAGKLGNPLQTLGWVHPVKASGVETEKWSTSPDTRTKGEGVEPGLCLQAYCSSLSQVLIKQNSYPHA